MSNSTARNFMDRVVIVTGAGSGIGRATAIAFAESGAHVLGVGRRKDALEETAGAHSGIAVLPLDIREEGAAERAVATAVEKWRRLDVLVNNAGTTAMMPLSETDRSVITDLFDLNVTAPSVLAHAALPHLSDSAGSIVNVSSTYGHRPLPGGAHYAATKSALEQLTRSWALELASTGVRVNAIAPGPTETDVLAAAGLPQDTINEIRSAERERIPVGRLGDPKDVADWILRLADPRDTHLTGQILTIDGGLELV
ncbi:SDR family oxidoreductase [Streptomyces sp. NPDC093228]|uniref:SDR family NAD(P)-dependent oxidoreductase n=2 Tax=Streptomyces TaxID=1883 RepID=UPI000741120A|nr:MULTISPECIES: SDR family oxidoreductase [unclassified Streptomyces]KUJ55859.1 ketoreductase [Streptomyces sp. NRRL F-5122]REE65544.1 NAD(P)-dependent dehydrogenase (short-subunit alcohol dehydrogenase family) [Streptomyces sp. 3212.3]